MNHLRSVLVSRQAVSKFCGWQHRWLSEDTFIPFESRYPRELAIVFLSSPISFNQSDNPSALCTASF
ncbi:hypothetical protein PCANC_17713 [Puccinia coronata f. sp. avenae]|uniref:Uncharacterized protein n=1 Tax=Puccinia coronata f. sp. avenae TaxID=200324 RepID=A0A2N5SHR0_9BASI|nr:hypothetical protein PCANC_17713 [Puccinia coronata f. sp. avenae]